MYIITYVLIPELRNYYLQTDVFLLINLGYRAPIVVLMSTTCLKSMSTVIHLIAVCIFCL